MTGQRELSPTEANVGHEDDDRHAIKLAPHNTGFFKTSFNIQDDHRGPVECFRDQSRRILNVMNQCGCQLIKAGGGRKKYCSVTANKN